MKTIDETRKELARSLATWIGAMSWLMVITILILLGHFYHRKKPAPPPDATIWQQQRRWVITEEVTNGSGTVLQNYNIDFGFAPDGTLHWRRSQTNP